MIEKKYAQKQIHFPNSQSAARNIHQAKRNSKKKTNPKCQVNLDFKIMFPIGRGAKQCNKAVDLFYHKILKLDIYEDRALESRAAQEAEVNA